MMTPEQITLVEDSFAVLLPRGDALLTCMYGRLFEIAPETQSMFASDMSEQKMKVSAALATVVHSLRSPSRIVPVLHGLGRRHVAYGVRPAHYDAVGMALLEALRAELDVDAEDEVMVAWAAAYGLVASTMQEGAAAATAESPS